MGDCPPLATARGGPMNDEISVLHTVRGKPVDKLKTSLSNQPFDQASA